MTTSQATYAAMLALDEASSRRADAVRARSGFGQQPTSAPSLQTSASNSDTRPEHRGLYLLAGTHDASPQRTHPGDIIYWVACLGGACLLLIMGTT